MDTESEEIMSRYNSMNDIIKVAEKNHNLKENLKQSLNPILTLLNDNYNCLNLKKTLSANRMDYFFYRNFEENIFKTLFEGDDLEIAINRAFYFESVSHTLKKYSSFSLSEEDITQIIEKSEGDNEQFTNLLIEYQEALLIFSISDLQ
ncbi:hypothetical protein RhiirA5_419067 [Rhizophagus irregularis]|uniref:Uncharacterized protein n=2 Tax=Rhizophagus irregularis TaxID=588596 RepID=A0A2I1EI05_9GLOM|nr:hypothetical protein RhiirA5_419067 [Rhizophagus irregularis]PKC59825.1 hypothetical protein RhiirA1_468903 [Rhizophagus irregularis]PKY21749.1 hypothetical protein RhiirB3_435440 [Rhizophagus irregularis]